MNKSDSAVNTGSGSALIEGANPKYFCSPGDNTYRIKKNSPIQRHGKKKLVILFFCFKQHEHEKNPRTKAKKFLQAEVNEPPEKGKYVKNYQFCIIFPKLLLGA